MKNPNSFRTRLCGWLAPSRTILQSLFLLVVRLFWGWQFFLAGKGKLGSLQKTGEFFQSIGIPLPHQQAILVGTTECVGGLLLLVGLASRLISIPLTILMTVAYLTADRAVVEEIFSNPDKFLAADEFLFLFAVVIVLLFGPGKFSIDWLLHRLKGSPSSSNQ